MKPLRNCTDREILHYLNRIRECQQRVQRYLSLIDNEKQAIYHHRHRRMAFKQFNHSNTNSNGIVQQVNSNTHFETNKVKTTECQTNESAMEVEEKENTLPRQMTFQSNDGQQLSIENIRGFINRYEQLLSRGSVAEQQFGNQENMEALGNYRSEAIEDVFRLSQSGSLLQSNFIITSPSTHFDYDTSNFGNNEKKSLLNKFEQLKQQYGLGKLMSQEQSIQAHSTEENDQVPQFAEFYDKQIKDSMVQIDQKIQNNDYNKQKSTKSFEQFYEEFVKDEITVIQGEIKEMHKFLKRVETARIRLSDSVKDLQQTCLGNHQNSQHTIDKVNTNLESIDQIRNHMISQLRDDINVVQLEELKSLKCQIQGHFNDVEQELIRLNEEHISEQ